MRIQWNNNNARNKNWEFYLDEAMVDVEFTMFLFATATEMLLYPSDSLSREKRIPSPAVIIFGDPLYVYLGIPQHRGIAVAARGRITICCPRNPSLLYVSDIVPNATGTKYDRCVHCCQEFPDHKIKVMWWWPLHFIL